MKVSEDAGVLAFEESLVRFDSSLYGSWSVNPSNFVLVGEFTNQDGPHLSDHFLVLVDSDRSFYEAPIDAVGFDGVWKKLAQTLGVPPELSLLGETDFSSRVLWPEVLQGRPVFDYVEKPSRSFIGRLFSPFGIGEIESRLSDHIEEYLAQKTGSPPSSQTA